jgi:hypothetical protein
MMEEKKLKRERKDSKTLSEDSLITTVLTPKTHSSFSKKHAQRSIREFCILRSPPFDMINE